MLRKRNVIQDFEDHAEETKELFKAYYIIIFSKSASPETVSWFGELLGRSQHEGGAELLVQVTPLESEEIMLEIGATCIKLLEGAEALEITKEDNKGNIREFVFSSLDDFLKPDVNINKLLSTSEKQRVVLEEIIGLRAMEKKTLIGYPDIQVFPGQSFAEVCKMNGIIDCIFPLHKPSELKVLKQKWSFKCLPLGDVRSYFGEAVGFYFAFICFYTWALLPPALIGTIQTIISLDISTSHIFFSIFKMIWLTLFLESWKRRSNELAYTWGTLRLVNIPKLHPTFRGLHMAIDPVTKQHIPVYPSFRRYIKVYCCSLPLVILCVIFAIIVMVIYFQVEEFAMACCDDGSFLGWILVQLPGIIYAVLVYVMNVIYSYIANVLTEWENHKTQESFDNHRIVKLLLFEFVNNFIAMGYIAFYQQDLNMLKWQIAVMMIVNQLFNQFQVAVLPFLLKKGRKKWKSRNASVSAHVNYILEQREMWSYDGTYDDYLEVFTQFGYVFLFSSVFPLAAVLALINNIIEMRMDGFKLCYSYQRPQSRPVKGIGVWQVAFEVLSLLAVMSNCALITMSLIKSHAPDLSFTEWFLVAVVVEHLIIALKVFLAYLISDVPKWVKVALQKAQYESLLALKSERKRKTKLMLQSMKMANLEKLE